MTDPAPLDLEGLEKLLAEAKQQADSFRMWGKLVPYSNKEPHTATLVRALWDAGQFVDRLSGELSSAAREGERLAARIAELEEAAQEAEEALDNYADASQEPGDSYPHPNSAMRALVIVQKALGRA